MKQFKNKKLIATIAGLASTILSINSQTLQWVDHYQTTGYYDNAFDVHIGGDSRIYTCGYKGNAGSDYDAMLISYTSSGTRNWAATYSYTGSANDYFTAMTSYGTGSSIAIYCAGTVNSGADMLLVKYNQSGTQQWAVTWNGGVQDIANAVTVDGSGNIYVCGKTSLNGGDVFVRKYNSSGTLQWGITYNSSGTQEDAPQYMKINSAGTSLYIASVRTISSTDHDAVLQKINTSSGSITWTSVWDNSLTSDIDETYSLDLDNNENIFLAGTTQTASTGYDALILKYNSSGTLLMANTWNNSTTNLDDALASIDVTHLTHTPLVYVTGYTQINVANNDADYLTMKFSDTYATPLWTSTYDGAGTGCPQANDDWAYMIMVEPTTDRLYVTGRTYETSAVLNATTLKYNASTGAQVWSDSYDRGGTDNLPATKYPMDMILHDCYADDHVYIAGYTKESSSTNIYDATTLKYGYSGPCLKLMNPNSNDEDGSLAAYTIIYPNPFSGSAIFECRLENIQNALIIVLDITGREISRIENINSQKVEISSEEMRQGIYYYKFIQNSEVISSGKFVIEK